MEQKDKERVVSLIVNYLTGKTKDEEVVELETWVTESPANHSYYLQVKNIWEVSGKEEEMSERKTEKALRKVIARIDEDAPSMEWGYFLRQVAAVLFIPLLAGSFIWGRYWAHKSDQRNVVYNEIHAAAGTRSNLKLSDGSEVWLNTGSSLKYPDHFVNNKRIVYLKGEAYFEVHSDVTRPFIVKTQSLSVRATGTRFCVEAYSNENTTSVTLIKGKVFVKQFDTVGKTLRVSEMVPDQHLEYVMASGKSQIINGDCYKYIAWKDGKLVFRNDPLTVVAQKISQIYNVEIEIRGKQLQDYRYHATFQEESLSEILKLLKLSSPINYKEVKRRMLPDGSFTKRKIIIYPINH